MVIDSSALIAILQREPEAPDFRDAVKLACTRLISAPTRVEAGIVALGRKGEAGLEQLQALLESLRFEPSRFLPTTPSWRSTPSSGSAGAGTRRA